MRNMSGKAWALGIAALLLGVSVLAFFSVSRPSDAVHFAAGPKAIQQVDVNASNDEEKDASDLDGAGETIPEANPKDDESERKEKLRRWTSVARSSTLQVLKADTLTLNPAVADLLGLTPGETQELSNAITRLMGKLRSAERANAYISVGADGGEEIVVPPFDRSSLVNQFRSEVGSRVSSEVAEFVSAQMTYDRKLSIRNSEVRLYIQRGADGLDRMVLTQESLRKDAVDAQTPIKSGLFNIAPTLKVTTSVPVGSGQDSRYDHLFSSVEWLPKRPRPAQ